MTEIQPFRWTRTTDLSDQSTKQEVWTLTHGEKTQDFDVNVTFGKPIDIKSIKKDWPFKLEIEICNGMRKFFEGSTKFVPVKKCPICGSERALAAKHKRVWSEDYNECGICRHAYMNHFPEEAFAEKYYEENYSSSGYYTDEKAIDLRLEQIYRPKIEWIIESYRKRYGQAPESVFDVGAGAGHALFAAKEKGVNAYGVERDVKFRAFCKETFDIELYSSPDEYAAKKFDVVMSFNVIEHVDDPFDFLSMYRDLLSDRPMAIVETPKYNSITSNIQSVFKDKIRGHLIPYQHSHMFSDSSLATLFHLNGLAISDVWIFGNDAIELILQIADELDAPASALIDTLYPKLQETFDRAFSSDIILIAAVPSD
jgi:cyclopropane fatty-acyl-phospholipid synthase-like methyltransferase